MCLYSVENLNLLHLLTVCSTGFQALLFSKDYTDDANKTSYSSFK